MDNSTGNQNHKTKTFLVGKKLKPKDLQNTAAEPGNREGNKTQEIKRIDTTLLTSSCFVYQ